MVSQTTGGERLIDQYPTFLDEGDLVLIGIWDEIAEYHHRAQNRVEGFTEEDGELTRCRRHQLGEDGTVVDHIRLAREAHGGYDALTDYGKAMCRAETLAETGAITRDQAEVYALRAERGVLRQDAANMLGKTPSTLDSLLVTAKDKVERAEELARRSVGSIQFSGTPAPLVPPDDLRREDLLSTREFEQLIGQHLVQNSEEGLVALTPQGTEDESYYVVGSVTHGDLEVEGVVRAGEANDALDIIKE